MGFDENERIKWIPGMPRMMPYKVLIKEIPPGKVSELEIEGMQSLIAQPFRPTSRWGEVVAIGKGKYFGKKFMSPDVKQGDLVAYNANFEDLKLKIGDDEESIYYIFDFGDILLTLEK